MHLTTYPAQETLMADNILQQNSKNKKKTAHGKEILSYSKARPTFERKPHPKD